MTKEENSQGADVTFLNSFFFTSEHFLFFCISSLSSSLLPSSFDVCFSSYTQSRQFLSKVLVYYCFLMFCRIHEYIPLDLFYPTCGSKMVAISWLCIQRGQGEQG